MALSKTAICNMALAKIGQQRIDDFASPTNKAGQLCQDFYEQARNETLAMFDWPRARKVLLLSQSSSDPDLDGKWDYKYSMPSDCVILRAVVDDNETKADFEVVWEEYNGETSQYIYTDLDDAFGVYTFENDDPSSYDPGLSGLMVYVLATYLAMPVTGKERIEAQMHTELERRISAVAKAIAAQESYVDSDEGKTSLVDAVSTGNTDY